MFTFQINYKHIIFYSRVETEKTAITLAMTEPMIQLKKIANHPYLVHMPLIPGTNNILVDENIVKVSGKFQVLDAMLTKLKTLGHKVNYKFVNITI
jgi:ATP-dependent DNA helicase